MSSPGRAWRTVLVMTTVLALAAGAAEANRNLRAETTRTNWTWRALTLNSPELESPVVCEFATTVELHERIAKIAGGELGFITSVSIRNCRNGAVTFLRGLALRLRYESFAGTLPNITSVRITITNLALLVTDSTGLARCLYGGDYQVTTGGGTTVSSVRLDETFWVLLTRRLAGAFFCPLNIYPSGTGTVEPTVRLSLI
jgi:hypothetical protein